MKKIFFLPVMLSFLLWSLVGCMGLHGTPDWVENPKNVYPDSQYLVAVGEGDTRQAAENSAQAKLARIFEAHIESDERLLDQTHENGKAFERTTDFTTDINILSSQTLHNIQHAEAWRDKLGRVHAVAYLDRRETANIYRSKIDEKTTQIHFLLAQAEQTDDLLSGIRIVMRALGVERAMIGIEDNKMDAVDAIAGRLVPDSPISVHAVQTKYPQGAEKMLIDSLLGRRVPSGSFPSAVGVSVFNVSTLAQIGALLPRGQGVIERVVTVTGPAVRHPGNYLVPVGTPVRFLLEFAGATAEAHELILGGPMMGMSVASLDVPVTKAVSGMVLLDAAAADQREARVQPCIRCAYCVEACPMHLNPSTLGLLAAKGEYETMAEQFHLNDCFECGCCSYVCPSNIPLVQYFRIAKTINREKAA